MALETVVMAGLSVALVGPKATTRIADVRECVAIASDGTKKALLAELDRMFEIVLGTRLSATVRIQRDALSAILERVPRDSLFVCIGSSADKLKMAFDHMGFATHSAVFSRESVPSPPACDADRSGSHALRRCSKKQVDSLRREFDEIENAFVDPLRRAFKEAAAKRGVRRIALIDFVDTGKSFAVMLELLRLRAPELYEVSHPVMIIDARETTETTSRPWSISHLCPMLTLVRMNPRAIEIPADFSFFEFSKKYRCVPGLGKGARRVDLAPLDVALCNAARVFYARNVMSR